MDTKRITTGGWLLTAIMGLSCVAGQVLAGDTRQANAEGKAFADRLNTALVKDAAKHVDPAAVPNYQGTEVPQTNYYGSGLAIEDEARTQADSDPNAQYISKARTHRPQFTINSETDPLFKRHEQITTQAQSLTETYSGCVDLPAGTQDQTSARQVFLCGSQLVCPDGQCTSEFGQSSEPATEVFKQAATSLAVANEIAKQFDPEHLSVFTGEAKSCRKSALGFADCCKDSGWGTDMGLAQCSEEEKALGLLKQASRVHYVGHYCSKDSMAGCLRKRYVYCAYPSKLSRIVVDQGKAQLGQHYGSSKHPDCRGFTLNELESLNFDAMDLSEFYAEVMTTAENGATPDSSGVAQAIQHQLESRFPELNEVEP